MPTLSAAAASLGVTRVTLRRRMRKLGIVPVAEGPVKLLTPAQMQRLRRSFAAEPRLPNGSLPRPPV